MDSAQITSLLPIAVALGLSLYARNVVVGLFAGVFVGVTQLQPEQPLAVLVRLVSDHLVPQITDGYNAGVLVLLVFIGGFVGLIEHSGGAGAFARRVTHHVSTRLRLQLATWLGGIMIFFSDLGTPLIVGPVFRPLADQLRCSREKLAWIVDSTASPVAILIPFIGWGVYIMGLLARELTAVGHPLSDWDAFVGAIPFQLYAWLAIAVVPLLGFCGVDFGPMARAEQRARQRGADDAVPGADRSAAPTVDHPNARPSLIWAPLVTMAAVLLLTLGPEGFPLQPVPGALFRAGLATAYFCAALVLIALAHAQQVRRVMDSVTIYLRGMSSMMQVAVTLVLAWTLADLGRQLGTPEYIAAVASAGLPPMLLPLTGFLLGGLISFATGSSWGTFAILLPLMVPAAVALQAPLLPCIGAVLSGGLFGDHASPISETTILSATGAGCSQFDHFDTQMPYAVANGSIAALGFVVAGFTASVWVLPGVLAVQLLGVLLLRRWTSPAPSPSPPKSQSMAP